MKLTTTLNLLRAKDVGLLSLVTLEDHVGKDYGGDRPINLLTILESNGVCSFFWAMRAIEQNFFDVKPVLITIVCDIAESVLPIFESAHPGDRRPRAAIEAARKVAADDTEENKAAAAYAAAAASMGVMPGSINRTTVYASYAAGVAALAACADDAVAYSGMADDAVAYSDVVVTEDSSAYAPRKKQKEIIKKYLSMGDQQ